MKRSLLSSREEQVADLAARGLADKEIAAALGLSYGTCRKYIDRAFKKYKVQNRTALAMARADERHLAAMSAISPTSELAHKTAMRRRR
jgi:DNA-binding NarL/FixJ family response regulator